MTPRVSVVVPTYGRPELLRCPAQWGVSVSKHGGLYRQRNRRSPRLDYYATVAALLPAPAAFALGAPAIGFAALGLWLAFTARFAARQLRGTRHEWRHVGEMLVSSAAVPLCDVFWRLVGTVRYRVVLL